MSRASSASARSSRRQSGDLQADEIERLAKNRNVLAALLEAVLGALFLEHGFPAVEDAVVNAFAGADRVRA